MTDKTYRFYDEESGEFKTGGEPTNQEEKLAGKKSGEFDPEKHPDNYIYRM